MVAVTFSHHFFVSYEDYFAGSDGKISVTVIAGITAHPVDFHRYRKVFSCHITGPRPSKLHVKKKKYILEIRELSIFCRNLRITEIVKSRNTVDMHHKTVWIHIDTVYIEFTMIDRSGSTMDMGLMSERVWAVHSLVGEIVPVQPLA